MLNVDVRMCIVTALELVTSYNVVHTSSRSNTSQYLIYSLKLGSGVGWRRNNCHFSGVRGGSPAKKIVGLRLCGTHFLSLC